MPVPNVKVTHIGRKIERIRELKGMKQDTLAKLLGVTQQTVSKIEQSEKVDDDKLQRVADALEVTIDTIKNFDEEAAIYNIQNNYDNATNNIVYNVNPIEKIVELYERMLKVEREKNELLEKMLNEKK